MVAKQTTRAREAQLAFESLSIEGGLLSPEWLSKIAQLQAGTQSEADYRIPKGLNLRDEIGRYWRIAQAHWADFKGGREAKADATSVSERFVVSLLRDSLGFTSLTDVEPVVVTGRSYPIGHAALGGLVPVVVASQGSGLDTLATAFGDTGRRRSAFGLAQEHLNVRDGALWGIASDGATLRIVRDNASLTRPAWIEVDIERIFTEERYADFTAFWLLCHETRFGREGQPGTECALEAWRSAGREEGTRARKHLRRGVEEALVALGQGFLSHADNAALRAELQNGTLPVKDYFNQLLRLVYRLIFLLTVEERGLLHPEGTSEATKTLYASGYGLRRLRDRSVKRRAHDRFSDLWEATTVVCRGLATGEPRLGLPALAGVFAANQCPALDAAKLENRALVLAVFKLAWLPEDGSLSRVNWRDMGPEELGSVYESLLELDPRIAKDGRLFALASGDDATGNARHTTGSYYTPDSLVQLLLDNALEPVVADVIAKTPVNPVEALLDLTIVDPACGSGHFLLAAARRLAAHVARLQANGTPSAAEYRRALRLVVGRCIFGVDVNPMAVELCKVGLWMEAVEPGLPLTFLNSHVQHGNALLGTTPELMAKGIPDTAWEPFEGDDRKIASALKKRNKAEAAGQRTLDFSVPIAQNAEAEIVTRAVAELDAATDASAQALAAKEERWDRILASSEYRHQKLVADAWCSAFFWPKQPGEMAGAAPTNELWRQIRDGQGQAPALAMETVHALAEKLRFFHWHLQFPQVVAKGGFDVVLGNPPWVRQELLKVEKRLLTQFASFASTADSSVYFIERAVQVGSTSGFVAMLTPNKWFRAAYAEPLRTFVRQKCRVTFIVDFGHSRTLFPDADTFPALVSLRPVATQVPDAEVAVFVRAHDSDLKVQALAERIREARVPVPHGSLKGEQWFLEDAAITELLARLLHTGTTLEAVLAKPVFRGLLTGFNDAFYVDGLTRDALVALDPSSAPLFRKMLRGRDIKRWSPEWAELWHIVIASSQNHTWPWSACTTEAEAEGVFAKTHPSVHQYLKKFESQLRARQDRGTFWWELRSCDYYDVLDGPKILVQCIAYYSQFALDYGGYVVNNKVLIVPSDDPFLVAVLNSRVVWWIVNRTFQHMKDEGLSVDVQYLKKLPIPVVSLELRAHIATLGEQIMAEGHSAARARLELVLDQAVMRAFGMTPVEERTLVENLPPRDPVERAKAHLEAEGPTLTVKPTVVPQLSATEAATSDAKVIPLPLKPAVRPQPVVAPAAAAIPDLAAIAANAWARPHTMDRGEISSTIVAVLKANDAPMDRRQARLASLLCLEPHFLAPMLDTTEKAHWARVVGADAKKAASTPIDATTQEWGAALTSLRGRERVLEDLQQNTWALGTGTEAIDTSGWPEGRATFVVNVLRRLWASTQVDAIVLKLPTTVQQWLASAA